jgi:hypothetical protein
MLLPAADGWMRRLQLLLSALELLTRGHATGRAGARMWGVGLQGMLTGMSGSFGSYRRTPLSSSHSQKVFGQLSGLSEHCLRQ